VEPIGNHIPSLLAGLGALCVMVLGVRIPVPIGTVLKYYLLIRLSIWASVSLYLGGWIQPLRIALSTSLGASSSSSLTSESESFGSPWTSFPRFLLCNAMLGKPLASVS